MKYHLNTKSQFEQEAPILSGNKLTFPIKNKEIILSKNQAKLINCLLNKTNEKSDIIKFIWGKGFISQKIIVTINLFTKPEHYLSMKGFHLISS